MKTELISNHKKTFNPVTVSLTFETQKELDTFVSLFRSYTIAEWVRMKSGNAMMPQDIYNIILNGNIKTDFISNNMTWQQVK